MHNYLSLKVKLEFNRIKEAQSLSWDSVYPRKHTSGDLFLYQKKKKKKKEKRKKKEKKKEKKEKEKEKEKKKERKKKGKKERKGKKEKTKRKKGKKKKKRKKGKKRKKKEKEENEVRVPRAGESWAADNCASLRTYRLQCLSKYKDKHINKKNNNNII